jgi:glycosyltransferase involved in cell wall biosynthesis
MADRALVLCPEAPYPITGGGSMRTACLVEYLRQHYDVDLIVFREPGRPRPEAACVIELPYHRRTPAARAWRATRRFMLGRPPLNDRFTGFEDQLSGITKGRRYKLAVIEHFWCATYADLPADRVVLDLHNVESAWYRSQAAAEPWPQSLLCRRFAACAERLERRWLERFGALLAASKPDAARLRSLAPNAAVHIYPNSIPLRDQPRVLEEDAIAFSGNMEYRPNQAAIRFFQRDIWPRVRSRHPGVAWRLIGRNAPRIAGAETVGVVEDAVAELAKAQVAVVPLLSGSGTRLKILEAWAAARPVVSTTIGAEGLEARDGEHLLLADTPAAFAEAVCRLLGDPAERARLGSAGRRLYERCYSWESAWQALHENLAPS